MMRGHFHKKSSSMDLINSLDTLIHEMHKQLAQARLALWDLRTAVTERNELLQIALESLHPEDDAELIQRIQKLR